MVKRSVVVQARLMLPWSKPLNWEENPADAAVTKSARNHCKKTPRCSSRRQILQSTPGEMLGAPHCSQGLLALMGAGRPFVQSQHRAYPMIQYTRGNVSNRPRRLRNETNHCLFGGQHEWRQHAMEIHVAPVVV